MTFTTHRSQIRTIKQDDARFRIVDKFTTVVEQDLKFQNNAHVSTD
jgi:hypothetical protein